MAHLGFRVAIGLSRRLTDELGHLVSHRSLAAQRPRISASLAFAGRADVSSGPVGPFRLEPGKLATWRPRKASFIVGGMSGFPQKFKTVDMM
jgi:hypothetical protein